MEIETILPSSLTLVSKVRSNWLPLWSLTASLLIVKGRPQKVTVDRLSVLLIVTPLKTFRLPQTFRYLSITVSTFSLDQSCNWQSLEDICSI